MIAAQKRVEDEEAAVAETKWKARGQDEEGRSPVTVREICRAAAWKHTPDEAIDFLVFHSRLQANRPALREGEVVYEEALRAEKARLEAKAYAAVERKSEPLSFVDLSKEEERLAAIGSAFVASSPRRSASGLIGSFTDLQERDANTKHCTKWGIPEAHQGLNHNKVMPLPLSPFSPSPPLTPLYYSPLLLPSIPL